MKPPNQKLTRVRDACNWPPMWVRLGKLPSTTGKAFPGEVGILKDARYYADRSGRIYLTMVHNHAAYVSCLLFENEKLCVKAFEHLQRCYGKPIEVVGSSELP